MEDYRNPNMAALLRLAGGYMNRLRQLAPQCLVELGGSLASRTAVVGHNDVDIRVLVPSDAREEILAVSAVVAPLIPFQKERLVGNEDEGTDAVQFGVMHQLVLNLPELGPVEIEVSIRPQTGYVGYARLQATLPAWLLEAYVREKYHAQEGGDKARYKQIKAELYGMTRALYRAGYFRAEV